MVRMVRLVATGSLLTLLATGCASAPLRPASEATEAITPELGSCHVLQTDDIAAPTAPEDATVDCADQHTAQTFAVGTLPDSTGAAYDDRRHGRWLFPRCKRAFERFLGVDESQALRVQLSWAWFRPSAEAWEQGARWYRCDVVGGAVDATEYRPLPETAEGLFSARPPEEWQTCAQGETVADSVKVSCAEEHDWRAVTTIKLGQPDAPYPGDRVVQVRSRDFCSDSVAAWMNYPLDYEFGYTWFREAEWQAGNRRSVCWARVT